MAGLSPQDQYLLDKATNPNSAEFAYLMDLLMTNPAEVEHIQGNLLSKGEFRYTIPFRGEPEDELNIIEVVPIRFPDRGLFRDGIASLALVYAELLDLVALSSNKKKATSTVCVTGEADGLVDTLMSAGSVSPLVELVSPQEFLSSTLILNPDTLIIDHTTMCAPIDSVLKFAFRMGIRVVDGVFPYHIAAVKGWDVVSGLGKWSYVHKGTSVTIGPDDDSLRSLKYEKSDYLKFVDPSRWTGDARKYGYELRKTHNGLVTYRAVYLGSARDDTSFEELLFSLPMCSSEDMVLVSVNRDLAAGVFVSQSNNAQDLAKLEKNYAIEVRKELFDTCVNYLIAKEVNRDILADAVRYIGAHNYVDLVDGVRIVRCPSLSYADALCVAMVCALTAFSLRYRLTSESLTDIRRHAATAKMLTDAPFGALGRIVWYMTTYITDAVTKVGKRAVEAAREMLFDSDYIPGVCYDVYRTVRYSPDLDWYEPVGLVLESTRGESDVSRPADKKVDPVEEFLAASQKTSAATLLQEDASQFAANSEEDTKYVPEPSDDPVNALQEFYDQALPGNSVGQIQNAAELRKVRDIEFHTEFYGRIEKNKDIPIKEYLHPDAELRTAALPVGRTSLVDAILASAKRNFNPPDLQMQNDPWAYARYLADKFKNFAFGPRMESIMRVYRRDPVTFNVQDYLEWQATRSEAYRSALAGECPEELLALNLEKFDTIVKKRVKPKLSTSAQYELAQPQVIVSLSKKDTAPFTSVFRKMFERFETLLRPGLASAGRMSDDDISYWLTKHRTLLNASDCIELDSSKYDKSQGLLARMVESLILTDLGLDPGVSEIFADSYVGKVSSMTLGLMFMSAYQMRSGAPDTMLGNIIYNMVSAMECVGPENIVAMLAKGDDNLIWVNKRVDAVAVVHRMSSLFNLETKLIVDSIWYFSSGYIVPTTSKLWFVPDPLKAVELLGEKGQDPKTLNERFTSFKDRVSSYTRSADIVPGLVGLVRRRMLNPTLDVRMCVDNLIAVAADFRLFERLVG